MTRRIVALSLAALLAAPAFAGWRTESAGTVFVVFYCAAPARAAKIPAMIGWRYGTADTVSQVLAAHWLRGATVASPANCTGGQTEIAWKMQKAAADIIAEAVLRSEGYDYDSLSPAQVADAFSNEFRDDLLQWEAEFNAHLAAEQAPAPDLVEPLNGGGP